MSNTLKFGNGEWYGKEGTILAYNDENNNYKPLPFTFDRASSATRVNKQGLIETVGADQPRIDYLNDSNGALLLEPSRTNLITYSDDFGNSDWNKGTGTITTNTSISPDGTLSADKYSAVSTSSFAFLSQTKSADASQSYTYSIWIKKVLGSGVLKLAISDVNLATLTSNNINLTNEFVRYSFSIETGDLSNTGSIGAGFINITSGDVIEVWGAQLEEGYATSYIPTSGSAVTRIADVCNNGGNEQVINSTEGTLYVEANLIDGYDNNNWLGIIYDNSNANNRVYIQRYLGNIQGGIRVNGVIQSEITQSNSSLGKNKIAFTFKENEFKMFVNGSQVSSTDTSGSVFSANTLNTLNVGVYHNDTLQFNSGIDDVKLYNTALTGQELAALTQV